MSPQALITDNLLMMRQFVNESVSINYCLCFILVSCTLMYFLLVKRYVYTFLLKKKFDP